MNQSLSFNAFFNPESIAVIGASNIEGKMGNLFIRHLLDGFPGKIYPVHPTESRILEIKAYPDVSSIPGSIDLVIPLIPSMMLIDFLGSCPKEKIKFLLAIPSGFGEVPKGGKDLEKKLICLAKERSIRVIGPNSVGMLNCTYGLNASMMPAMPSGAKGLSIITQSGGFGMAVYMYCQNHQMGLSKLCDLGNTADISLLEMLNFLGHDDDTRIIGLYLESIPDEELFLARANEIAEKKPVILTKLGRTQAGRRASFAHIGINSVGKGDGGGSDRKDQGRVIWAQTGLEMLNISKGLSWQPLPRGKRVGIITGSGGIGAELTDLCVEHGLEVPEFSEKLQER
ncbi:MAG: CoA-binding protein, partial [Thermodesulfobacteriota bacterium]